MGDSDLPKPGDLIGVRYRIESLLGQGGMGAVFAAVNQATGRAVAIKWMLPSAARSKESLARFLAEARATAKIEHPNVVQILDVGQDGGAPFLVMERLRGESLAERLERAGRLTPEEALRVLIPACKGLREAHSEGIIHRDIKPDNIFLCRGKDGSPRPPKVLDFGISKLFDEDGGDASMTKTGIAMGTPWYMSPEQLNAPPTADARFDVYAMGVVLYECLTGRPPYNAEGLFELVQQIVAGTPTPIRALAVDVPPDLEAVTMRAMAANRDLRYATMEEFVRELEWIEPGLRRGSEALPPTGPAAATGPAPGLGMGPAGGGWTGTGSPVGGSAYATPTGWAPTNDGYGAPMRTPGSRPIPAGLRASGSGKGLLIGLLVAVLGLGALGVLGIGAAFFVFRSSRRSGSDDGVIARARTGGGVVSPGGLGNTVENPRDPRIELTFSGACSPTFGARRMVTSSLDSINVISSSLGGVTGSVILSLPNVPTGTIRISTQNRIDTQTVINVMAGQELWTNMTMDTVAVARGRIEDPIRGHLTVTQFDPELAVADLTFQDVTLQSLRDGSLCTLNGRLRTAGVTYGM